MTDFDADFEITEAMIRFGGGFVSGLGRLWRSADQHNKAVLRAAFPGYWKTYRELARFNPENVVALPRTRPGEEGQP